MIIRVKHDAHYTVIRNKTLRDSRLSFKATGLLAWLLSMPDEMHLERELIEGAKTDGQHSIRGGLQELATAGYITYDRVQGADGKWRTIATIRERPNVTEGGKPTTGKGLPPKVGKPVVGFPTTSTKYQGKGTRRHAAASPVDGPCVVCCEPARHKSGYGEWICDQHRLGS